MMRKWIAGLLIAGSLLWCTGMFRAQPKSPEIEVTELYSNLYRFSCGVNNWLVFTGTEGVLLVDTGPEIYTDAMVAKLRKMGYSRVRFIVNTHWHHDHTGGNLHFGKQAAIIGHHSVRTHLLKSQEISMFKEKCKAYPEYACPDILFSSGLTIHLNGEHIEVIHLANGHTAGDAVVYFTRAKILFVGDLYVCGHFPMIDFEHGGDVLRLAANLEKIIEIMPAEVRIVSGHLHDGTIIDIRKYREMILSTCEIVETEMHKGSSLDEMKRAQILKEWRNWGKHITCDMWIEMIYHSLKARE